MKKMIPSLLLLIAITSCGKVKDPEFRRLDKFAVKSFGIEKVDLGFTVTYYNPNNFGVSVKEAVADFYVDSVYMGKFTQDQEIAVVKNNEFSVPLSGSIPLSSALKLKLNDLANRELFIRANGSVKVGKAGVYLNRPFSYSGKHKVDLKL